MNKSNNVSFAEWLQGELDRRGWDSLDLAVEAFISEQSVKNYLHGDRYPTLDYFMRIIRALGKRIEITDSTGVYWVLK